MNSLAEAKLRTETLPRVIFNTKKIQDIYKITKLSIGYGFSGKLYICKNRLTNEKFVIKTLKKSKRSLNEIKIQLYLKSKYIINIVDIFKDNIFYYLILEYANGGDLFDKLNDIELDEYNMLSVLYNISLLIQFIHTKNIVHADLKLENILIKDNSLKLCDFGFSKFNNVDAFGHYYTIPYAPPEQLVEVNYNNKVDIWALGIITYYFYFFKFPFNYTNISISCDKEEINHVLTQFKSEKLDFTIRSINPQFQTLILQMLNLDQKERPNITNVIKQIKQIILTNY